MRAASLLTPQSAGIVIGIILAIGTIYLEMIHDNHRCDRWASIVVDLKKVNAEKIRTELPADKEEVYCLQVEIRK